jgi:hypothetical protein
MSKMLIINTLFIVYCVGLVVAISSVNHELQNRVDNRRVYGGTLQVRSTTDYGASIEVKPTIDQSRGHIQQSENSGHLQRGLNHDGSRLVQQTQHNRWSKVQFVPTNYEEKIQLTVHQYYYQAGQAGTEL